MISLKRKLRLRLFSSIQCEHSRWSALGFLFLDSFPESTRKIALSKLWDKCLVCSDLRFTASRNWVFLGLLQTQRYREDESDHTGDFLPRQWKRGRAGAVRSSEGQRAPRLWSTSPTCTPTSCPRSRKRRQVMAGRSCSFWPEGSRNKTHLRGIQED